MEDSYLQNLRNKAIKYLFNIDIIRDNSYVYDTTMEQGGLEKEDLEFSDPSLVFTIDNFTLYSPKNMIEKHGLLFINFNGKLKYDDEPENCFGNEYKDLISTCTNKGLNINFINFVPLRTRDVKTFKSMFNRTELNGIVFISDVLDYLYKNYIKKVIDYLEPETLIITDKDIIKIINKYDEFKIINGNEEDIMDLMQQ